MPRTKIDDVKPGMILGEDVTDGRNVLLNAGQTIDNRLIQMLRQRGIAEVLIDMPAASGVRENEIETAQDKAGTETKEPAEIRIYISHDQMAASATIEPRPGHDGPITVGQIKKALVDAGVAYGYLENEIQALARRFSSTRDRIENFQLAKGKLAVPGKQGELTLVVPYISSHEDNARVTSVTYACDAKGVVREGFRVDPGTLIGRRMDPQPAQPGTDVCGEVIEIEEVTPVPISLGPNVEAKKDDTQFAATTTGVVCYVDKTLAVVPLCFDAKAELMISDDKMEARLTLVPPMERGAHMEQAALEKLLEESKITFGIRADELHGIIKEAAVGNAVKDIVLAKGEPPVNGRDGRVEFLFDVSGKAKPKAKEDGTVDFKNIKLIESAVEGQELARLLPPTPGTPGHNIFGQEIPCSTGGPIQMPAGANTALKPGDASVLIATATGNVRYTGTLIEVTEGFSIKGDVDFSTGNVKYPKSVRVCGDIKSGFAAEIGGDLEIDGTLEDAQVECGGNVLVKCGFIGSGKGLINAKGNVNIAFVRNQSVRSRQDIFVAKEAIGARLSAKNDIEVNGKPFSIAGGHISARHEIRAYAIGNENGTRTEVEVGIDFTLVEEQLKTDDKIKELNASRQKVIENLQKLRHIKQLRKVLQPKEEFLLKKLEAMEEKINVQLSSLETRKQVIAQKLLEVGKARIVFEHAIYPGTVIKIRDRHMVVNKEIVGPKSIMYVKGELKAI